MPLMRGFSLVEVMMAMAIASIGVLAVTQSSISSMSNNLLARERIAGTNLALDVIESWQASTSDALPALECTNGAVILTASGNSTCRMVSQEVKTEFTITVSTKYVQAPMQPATSGVPVMDYLYSGLRITSLLVDKNDTTHLYAGTEGYGLFESNDSASSWNRISATGYLTIHALTQFNSTSTTVVAGTDSYAMANTSWGGSWKQLVGSGSTILPDNANVLSVSTDSFGTLFAGLDIYTNVNYGGVFKSLDTGATWNTSLGSSGSPYTVYSLVAGTYIYAGTNQGIRYSTNDGTSWAAQSSAPSGSVGVYALAYSQNTLYAGTSDGVSSSGDNGATWTADSVTGNTITALFVASDGVTVTAGTKNNGVYSDLCGSSTPATNGGMTLKSQLRVFSIAVPPVASPTVIYRGTDAGMFKTVVSSGTCGNWTRADTGIGLVPQEKIVTVSWSHKGKNHSVVLTHISEKPY